MRVVTFGKSAIISKTLNTIEINVVWKARKSFKTPIVILMSVLSQMNQWKNVFTFPPWPDMASYSNMLVCLIQYRTNNIHFCPQMTRRKTWWLELRQGRQNQNRAWTTTFVLLTREAACIIFHFQPASVQNILYIPHNNWVIIRSKYILSKDFLWLIFNCSGMICDHHSYQHYNNLPIANFDNTDTIKQ